MARTHNDFESFGCNCFCTGAYFKKVRSAFDTKETPHSYYLSLIKDPVDAQTQHEQWIAAIRDATWERTYFEESSVASLDALRYHFKRGLWTVNYWSQAISAEMNTLPVTECGWKSTASKVGFGSKHS